MEAKVWKAAGVAGFDGFQIMGDASKGIKVPGVGQEG